jgi:hypothetical protein
MLGVFRTENQVHEDSNVEQIETDEEPEIDQENHLGPRRLFASSIEERKALRSKYRDLISLVQGIFLHHSSQIHRTQTRLHQRRQIHGR